MPWNWNGLGETGYVFFPNECYNVECHLNVILHGCMNGNEMIGKSLVINSGFAEYAVTNKMILLFPQAEFHYRKNFAGCWDYAHGPPSAKVYGDDDEDELFYTNKGVQNRAIKNMIEIL